MYNALSCNNFLIHTYIAKGYTIYSHMDRHLKVLKHYLQMYNRLQELSDHKLHLFYTCPSSLYHTAKYNDCLYIETST